MNKHQPVNVFPDPAQASVHVAQEIAGLIRKKAACDEHAVLGLATGSTPLPVYNELIRMHREEGLSFANVFTFNLDEYYPMLPEAPQSYVHFMKQHLFDHIDLPDGNWHVPDGTVVVQDVPAHCDTYENSIDQLTNGEGIDIQLLGIGRTGHIGFNEPGSGETSRTRLVSLALLTRADAAKDFGGLEHVPTHAITMGVGTILSAKRLIMMAWGSAKASIVAKALGGQVTDEVPASCLLAHRDAAIVLDEFSALSL